MDGVFAYSVCCSGNKPKVTGALWVSYDMHLKMTLGARSKCLQKVTKSMQIAGSNITILLFPKKFRHLISLSTCYRECFGIYSDAIRICHGSFVASGSAVAILDAIMMQYTKSIRGRRKCISQSRAVPNVWRFSSGKITASSYSLLQPFFQIGEHFSIRVVVLKIAPRVVAFGLQLLGGHIHHLCDAFSKLCRL